MSNIVYMLYVRVSRERADYCLADLITELISTRNERVIDAKHSEIIFRKTNVHGGRHYCLLVRFGARESVVSVDERFLAAKNHARS